jgi:MYXO-CTERM domain-containing protein
MSRRSFRTVKSICAVVLSAIAWGGVTADAGAHTRMDMPKARDMQDGYKPTRSPGFVLPCGIARSASQPINTLTAGSTIGMKWTETVYHPGCFIIDFAKNDTGPSTVFQRLQIEPHAAGSDTPKLYQVSVKLPAEPCTNCVLRVRQYMVGSNPCPPTNLKDNDANLYYSCANVVLETGGGGMDASAGDAARDASNAADVAGPTGGTAGGSGGAMAGSGGATAGSGGAFGSGGAPGSGGAALGSGGSGSGTGGKPVESSASGGCAVGAGPASGVPLLSALLGLGLLLRRRRR